MERNLELIRAGGGMAILIGNQVPIEYRIDAENLHAPLHEHILAPVSPIESVLTQLPAMSKGFDRIAGKDLK